MRWPSRWISPRVRAVERAEQVQQRALARAALADDRQELAVVDVEIDAAQHRDFDLPLAIAFDKPAGG